MGPPFAPGLPELVVERRRGRSSGPGAPSRKSRFFLNPPVGPFDPPLAPKGFFPLGVRGSFILRRGSSERSSELNSRSSRRLKSRFLPSVGRLSRRGLRLSRSFQAGRLSWSPSSSSSETFSSAGRRSPRSLSRGRSSLRGRGLRGLSKERSSSRGRRGRSFQSLRSRLSGRRSSRSPRLRSSRSRFPRSPRSLL